MAKNKQDTLKNLADSIINTAKIREESWKISRYELSINQAATKVRHSNNYTKDICYLTNVLLLVTWNEALEWAKRYK